MEHHAYIISILTIDLFLKLHFVSNQVERQALAFFFPETKLFYYLFFWHRKDGMMTHYHL